MSSQRRRRVAVITGASAGVGRAVVREFARRGYDIGLVARGEEGLEAAAREVHAEGGRALVLPTDVAQKSEVDGAADAVETQLGPINVWVNNAMVSILAPIEKVSADEFRRVTEVTYLGTCGGRWPHSGGCGPAITAA